MKLTITEKKEAPLLNRIEIKGAVIFDKVTPSNEELKKQLAAQEKSKPELVAIKHIYTAYGKSEAEFFAYIYNSEKDLKIIEPKPNKKQGKPGSSQEKPAAEKQAEKKEEKQAEQPKPEKTPKEAPAEEKGEEK